ncbi:MAG: 2-oxoacid:acceptor oxidoreductase family protein [Deltaproteobacteria bacterium]|jgi:2-oxoacid:acceptor oxidoreductase gamma subunit (pyruvate/2-ketoisovalerate family)|nr:2-oxoacid:acceptor oxidoreductase family protein [Deltaproteobacteria bacterium]
MKEIRMHGRGGQGVVKSAQIVVKAVVNSGGFAHFIPFFGVERKGSPVFGFLRIDERGIRQKCQVYEPEILLIYDDTLLDMPQTYAGMLDGCTVIINTSRRLDELAVPGRAGAVALVDASGISRAVIGRNIPNTAMLGAFAKVCGLVDWPALKNEIEASFDARNSASAREAWDSVQIVKQKGA